MSSSNFQNAVVASIAVSVPALIEFVLNSLSGVAFNPGISIPKMCLLLDMLLSNVLILIVAIPMQSPEFLSCVFQTRFLVYILGAYALLHEIGAPVFCGWLVITIYTIAAGIGMSLSYYSFETGDTFMAMRIINIGLFALLNLLL